MFHLSNQDAAEVNPGQIPAEGVMMVLGRKRNSVMVEFLLVLKKSLVSVYRQREQAWSELAL
jgi:hypothetical protein